MAKFRFKTGIGYVGCEEEEKLIDNWFDEWVWQQIESKTGWQKLEE
jgi:hypothetical protein